MGAEIDRLELQVETQATKANNQLDKLVGKLDTLSSSLSHLNSSGLTGLSDGVTKFAQASSQLSNVKTTDFTRLTKNIDKLANLNTQQIVSASSAIVTLSNAVNSLGSVSANSMQVVDVANSIGKLGSASVQKAITNLPALATAMNGLMTTLSNAPSVNRNIIDMTNALANLSAQGNRVGSASNSIVNGLNRTSSAMVRTRKSSLSLAAAFGKFYASWFLVVRGINKLWDSIENSMNYIEVLNYFDAAMQQVSANAGESSADAYFESFNSRAKELTSKMTGFNVNENGTLTATGNASLGINPTKLMNYQATFAQMSSSIGVASETSLLLSQALTEIGADLASVKNMDFDKVWKDMASGLAGMSRTLDKYGVNIRNVNLQQKLFDLGIEENITNLNQNDKALLRAIILLDSTKYAWGDLADTLEQPANQLRLLESNFSNLSRTLGNLFLPVVSRVLPYVNGLVIGLQRLFTWLGSIMGIDLSTITSAVGESEVDLSELLGDTDDLTDSLTDAGNAAKKLKSNLQAFDELNVITTQTDSDSSLSSVGLPSGLLDAAFEESFSEYQKAWDEAFANMENWANEFADKVEEYLQPVMDIIEDFAIGDFFKAGQDTSNLVAGIFNFFADAIDNVDWKKIGNNIGDYLEGIDWADVISSAFKLKFNIWKAIAEVWFDSFDAAPIETSIITAIGVLKFTKLGKVIAPKIASAIMGTSLVYEMKNTWTSLGGIGGILTEDIATIAGAGTLTEIGMTIGIGIIGGITAAFVGFEFGKEIGKWLFPDDAEYYENFHWLGEDGFFDEISKDWKVSIDAADEMLNDIQNNDIYKIITGAMNLPQIKPFKYIKEDFIDLKNEFDKDWDGVENWFNRDILPWTSKEKWEELGSNFKSGLSEGWEDFTEWWEGTGIPNWWDDVSTWFTKEKWMNLGSNVKTGLSDEWIEFSNWWKTTGLYKWWNEYVEPFFSKETWTWSGIEEGLSESWDAAIESVKNLWNNFANWLNDKLTINIDTSSIIGKGISEILGTSTLSLGVIPTFSIGGFPEDGLFMANRNELVGQFSNGKTAVANNYQIQEGIEEAAYRGMARALAESGGSNVKIHVEGDSSGMYRVWKEEYKSEATRLQKNPVPIFSK